MSILRFRAAAARLLRPLAAVAIATAAPSCGDRATSGPGIASPASVAVAPSFQAPIAGGPVIVLERVEGWLVPIPAADSAFAEATFAGESAALAFDVVVTGLEQRFVFRLGAFADGERVFASVDTIVVRPGENEPVDGVQLAYVARDAEVTDFVIDGRTTSLVIGDTVHLSARACCSSGEEPFEVNAGWVSRDPLVAGVEHGTGVVTGVAPGRAWIVATLFNGARDSLAIDVAAPMTRSWLGGDANDPTDWTNPRNWSPAGAPSVGDTVVVPVTPDSPVLRVEATVAELSVAAGATLRVDSALTVFGGVSGSLVGTGTVYLTGADATLAGEFPSLVITQTATAVGDVRVTGSLRVTGDAGRFRANGTSSAVAGDLVVDNGAVLVMGGGRLDVEGTVVFAGANGPGTLTGGTLAVRGDFAAQGIGAFHPDAGFLVVLDGAKAMQRVTMDAPGPNGQHFADVVVANATVEGVRFEGVHIAGSLKDDGVRPARVAFDGGASQIDGGVSLVVTGGDIGGTGTLTVVGDVEAMSSSVSVAVLRLAGPRGTEAIGALGAGHAVLELIGGVQPLRSGLAYRGVRVAGSARLVGPEPVTFDGSLEIVGDAAQLAPSGVPLVVSGDLATGLKGVLVMTNDADDVTVKGAVTVDGGATAAALVYGTLHVGRDFTVACKTAECFQPGTNGNFTVRFDGVETQSISLSLPGAAGDGNDLQRFRNVRVSNAAGVTFATGAPIVGNMLVEPEGVATIPAGIWVDVFGTLTIDRSGMIPGRIDNFGELYAGVDDTSGDVKPNPVLPRK